MLFWTSGPPYTGNTVLNIKSSHFLHHYSLHRRILGHPVQSESLFAVIHFSCIVSYFWMVPFWPLWIQWMAAARGVLLVDAEEASPPLLHLKRQARTSCVISVQLTSPCLPFWEAYMLCSPGGREASVGGVWLGETPGTFVQQHQQQNNSSSHKCGLFTPVGQAVPTSPPPRDSPVLSSVAADSVSGTGADGPGAQPGLHHPLLLPVRPLESYKAALLHLDAWSPVGRAAKAEAERGAASHRAWCCGVGRSGCAARADPEMAVLKLADQVGPTSLLA